MPSISCDGGAASVGSDSHLQPSRPNYFVRLFKGDVRLVITFWVWGVLFGILVPWLPWFGLELVSFYYLDEITGAYFSWYQAAALSLAVFVFAYLIFSWIAVWRSAGKYQGRFWGTAARVYVLLDIAAWLSELLLPTEFPG